MKLWQRYLLSKLISSFLTILCCLFAIYVLIDLSLHGVRFLSQTRQYLELSIYYLRLLALHLDLFFPLAFLLASLKTLLNLSAHLELVALQAGGVSKKKLLAPFFFFALLLSLLSLANHEWILPDAGRAAETFWKSHSKSKHKAEEVHALVLEDGSEWVYKSFDEGTEEFYDLFWIQSASDIWAIKTLSKRSGVGKQVEHLTRNAEGLFVRTEYFETYSWSALPLPQTLLGKISKTHLHRNLAVALLPPLIAFAVLPSAMTFSRQRKSAYIIGLSLFGFVVVMMLFESLVILGENQVVNPAIAMWIPVLAILGFGYILNVFQKLGGGRQSET